jgi:uncharacterized protein YkuJ
MAEVIETILNRIKNLRQFEVEVDLPDNFELNGVIPYDVSIKQNKGIFKVYASTLAEARTQINNYVSKNIM